MKYNPDWKVIFWQPKEPFKGRSWYTDMYPPKIDEKICKDYLPELLKLDIEKIIIDFKKLGARPNLSEVHKNDYIRVSALNNYGGLWSDTDIIYFKGVENLKINTEENKDKQVYVCISNYGHSTGFNMAKQGTEFFTTMVNLLNREYHPQKYQCWGPDMWNKYYKNLDYIFGGVEIGMEAVYAHNCHQVGELLNGSSPRFTEHSIGCHWYGGNTLWPDFFNRTAGGETNLGDNIISKLIKDAEV